MVMKATRLVSHHAARFRGWDHIKWRAGSNGGYAHLLPLIGINSIRI